MKKLLVIILLIMAMSGCTNKMEQEIVKVTEVRTTIKVTVIYYVFKTNSSIYDGEISSSQLGRVAVDDLLIITWKIWDLQYSYFNVKRYEE